MLIIINKKYTQRFFATLSFLLKKGAHYNHAYKYNYKIYKIPISFFLRSYVSHQSDYEPSNPAEIFKLNNLMYLNLNMLWLFDKIIVKFVF